MKCGAYGVADVGPLDPVLWAALASCGTLAWLAGMGIGRLALRLRQRRFRSLVVVAACVIFGPGLTILTHVTFLACYRVAHALGDNWIVSEAFAFPLLVVPTILLCVSARRAVTREAGQPVA